MLAAALTGHLQEGRVRFEVQLAPCWNMCPCTLPLLRVRDWSSTHPCSGGFSIVAQVVTFLSDVGVDVGRERHLCLMPLRVTAHSGHINIVHYLCQASHVVRCFLPFWLDVRQVSVRQVFDASAGGR